MNKSELIAKLAVKTGLTATKAKAVVDAIFGTDRNGILTSELTKGRKVMISGFGSFEIRKRKARQGRNPQTGESIKIAASRFAAFHPGKALKEAVRR
jgi:DNA-binding protein HU-beta